MGIYTLFKLWYCKHACKSKHAGDKFSTYVRLTWHHKIKIPLQSFKKVGFGRYKAYLCPRAQMLPSRPCHTLSQNRPRIYCPLRPAVKLALIHSSSTLGLYLQKIFPDMQWRSRLNTDNSSSYLPTNVDSSHQLYLLVSPQIMIVKIQMRRLRKSQPMTVTY